MVGFGQQNILTCSSYAAAGILTYLALLMPSYIRDKSGSWILLEIRKIRISLAIIGAPVRPDDGPVLNGTGRLCLAGAP